MTLADLLGIADPAWMEHAACADADPGWWFPPSGGGNRAAAKLAKATCGTCPVRAKCLDYALSLPTVGGFPIDGIWGGLSARERSRLKGAS